MSGADCLYVCTEYVCVVLSRRVSLLREKEQQSEQHEDTLQRLQTKHEADISHFQQEHTLSAAKVANGMC